MINREPSLTVGTITAFIAAALALAVAFGIDVSEPQKQAILGLIGPLFAGILAASAIIRGLVYSPNTVARLETEAYSEGATGTALTPAESPPSGT